MSESEKAAEALTAFLDAVEAGVAGARRILNSKPVKTYSWDPNKISWAKDEGFKGEYERSEDVNSLDFKAMLKDLAVHKGNLWRDGYFYWTFKNGSTVGRKKKEKQA